MHVPLLLQILAVCLMAAHVVSQPKPMVKPHAKEAMAKSSLVVSSRTKCGLSKRGMKRPTLVLHRAEPTQAAPSSRRLKAQAVSVACGDQIILESRNLTRDGKETTSRDFADPHWTSGPSNTSCRFYVAYSRVFEQPSRAVVERSTASTLTQYNGYGLLQYA